MKKKVYVVRHGQTEFNVQKRCQGWSDSPLTEKGMAQARKVRAYFDEHGIRFDHAYASDLQRAIDTMCLITAGYDIPRFTTAGLREMSFGRYDGAFHADIPSGDMATYFKTVGGETMEEAIVRAYKTIVQIMAQPDHECVLCVSHGIPVSGLFRSLPRDETIEDPRDFRNGCILEYEIDGYDMKLVRFVQTEKEKFVL